LLLADAHSPPCLPWRTEDLPSSRTDPIVAPPMLLRPRPNQTELTMTRCLTWLRLEERPQLQQLDFRGSITWLGDSLSTLRSARSPVPHARLASDCAATLYRVGLSPTGFAMKSFSDMSVHIAFSFRELTWRDPLFWPEPRDHPIYRPPPGRSPDSSPRCSTQVARDTNLSPNRV